MAARKAHNALQGIKAVKSRSRWRAHHKRDHENVL